MNEQIITTTIVQHPLRVDLSSGLVHFLERNRCVKLTPTEARMFAAFVQQQLLSDSQVAEHVFHCPLDKKVYEMMEKHIDNLRAKIRAHGCDIRRVMRYGYVLLFLE
jgi:DNA-binding response OmpR family regulator